MDSYMNLSDADMDVDISLEEKSDDYSNNLLDQLKQMNKSSVSLATK